jgi:FkbM family methyltransferase
LTADIRLLEAKIFKREYLDMLKKIVFKILRLFNFDFKISHHWVPGASLSLNSFQHKNYWWHGKNRERDEMEAITRLVRPGQTIVEVGGHIGYLTVLFRNLVGEAGTVHVFEPGKNNLKYLKRNVANYSNVFVYDFAVSNTDGYSDFFEEDLSGQNNSLLENLKILKENSDRASIVPTVKKVNVRVVTLDRFLTDEGIVPDLVKIDVEGAEYLVLLGMVDLLKLSKPNLMLEATSNKEEIFEYLRLSDYKIFNPRLEPVNFDNNEYYNFFCIHSSNVEKLLF